MRFAATLLHRPLNKAIDKYEPLPDLLKENPNFTLNSNSPLVLFLREHKHFSLVESLERKIEDTPEDRRMPLIESKNDMERLGASMVAPIFVQNDLIAVLVLGPKLSGDSFSNDDIQLVEVLGPQIGSAIQKSNLYEEVLDFTESLKDKVAEATAQLRERNVSLMTLQNITREITKTLDFKQVVQRIADSVANELGYLGAIIVLLDDDGQTVRPRAVTATPLTNKALKLLPKGLGEFPSRLDDPNYSNFEAAVMRTGRVQITDHISDIICPPMPRPFADTMQKVLGIKSVVVVPVNSEGRTIGAIEIGTHKPKADLTRQEIATMQSMADELGVVYRNLKLFEQIRRANDQLEVANEHLKELDKAKSEFVSIASHQLRTPMTGIMGYLSMMTQGDFGQLQPEHAAILRSLLSESQRMIRLINQFLNVSKIEAGKFTYQKAPVQLADLVSHEVNEIRKLAADKKLELELKLPKKTLPLVTADADKLEDVILNLVDNAIKYTSKGRITVGLETVAGQPETGQSVRFYVKDTGVGIKKSDAPKLFSKFIRGTGIAQIHPDGSGLGLFIAKSVIDAHGGRIWVESSGEGKGSTFQFIIPVKPPPESDEQHGRNAAVHIVSTRQL